MKNLSKAQMQALALLGSIFIEKKYPSMTAQNLKKYGLSFVSAKAYLLFHKSPSYPALDAYSLNPKFEDIAATCAELAVLENPQFAEHIPTFAQVQERQKERDRAIQQEAEENEKWGR